MGAMTRLRAAPRWAARRWRGTTPGRRWLASIFLASVAAIGFGLGSWWWTAWPARAVLQAAEAGDQPLGFSPDGSTVATWTLSSISTWGVDDGKVRATWPMLVPSPGRIAEGFYAPDGKTIAAFWYDRKGGTSALLEVLDATTGRSRGTIDTRFERTGVRLHAFLDGGRTLRLVMEGATPGTHQVVDCDLEAVRVSASRPLACPKDSLGRSISSDGRTLAFAPPIGPGWKGRRFDVVLWDLDGDREVGRLVGPPGCSNVTTTEFSTDGATVAVARFDGAIELWDRTTRRVRSTLRGHSAGFSSGDIVFAPDGSTLASWASLSRPALSVKGVRMQLGLRLLGRSRGFGETVVIDTATGRLVGRAKEEYDPIYSPDGRTLATGVVGGAVQLRSIPGGSPQAAGR